MTDQADIIEMTIDSKEALKASYLPFIKNGGLIIPTQIEIGKTCIVRLMLMNEKDPLEFDGEVVWVTPPGSHLPQYNGVAIQFIGENAKNVREKIELYLAGS